MEQVTAPTAQTQSGSVNPLVISVTIKELLDIFLAEPKTLSSIYRCLSELVSKSDGVLAIHNLIEYITKSPTLAKDEDSLPCLVGVVCKLITHWQTKPEELLALPGGCVEKFFDIFVKRGDYHSFQILSDAFGKRTPSENEIADIIRYHRMNVLNPKVRAGIAELIEKTSLSSTLKQMFSDLLWQPPL